MLEISHFYLVRNSGVQSRKQLKFNYLKTLKNYEEALMPKRKKLYNKLLKESAGNPSTPFEFIPISDTSFNLNSIDDYLMNNFYKFGY